MTHRIASSGRKLALAAAAALVLVGTALAANFTLTKSAENNNTITFTYPQQAGADGYRYYAPGTLNGEACSGTAVSRTLDPTRTSVRFSKVSSGQYCVEAVLLTPIGAGAYPAAPPPPPPPACSNGKDDDGDGKVDYPADPGCSSATDTDETDPAPPAPACSNGKDDDGDGKIDYPADPGCTSATDTDETDSGGTLTTITPSQFQSRATSGASISNVHVTGSVSVSATNVAISNSAFDGDVSFTPSAGGSSLRGSSALGFDIDGADGIVIENNHFDGQGRRANNHIWDTPAGNSPSNWVLRGNDFRNYYIDPCCNVHSEALYVGYSDHGLIEGNTFVNNGNTAHLFFTWFGNLASPPQSDPHDICVRGNTFGAKHDAYFDINTRDELNPLTLNLKVDPTSNKFTQGVDDSRLLATC